MRKLITFHLFHFFFSIPASTVPSFAPTVTSFAPTLPSFAPTLPSFAPILPSFGPTVPSVPKPLRKAPIELSPFTNSKTNLNNHDEPVKKLSLHKY